MHSFNIYFKIGVIPLIITEQCSYEHVHVHINISNYIHLMYIFKLGDYSHSLLLSSVQYHLYIMISNYHPPSTWLIGPNNSKLRFAA